MEVLMISSLKKELRERVPGGFLEDFISGLVDIYQSTFDILDDLGIPRAQARDLLPHLRRAKADALLKSIATEYDLEAIDRKNIARNCNHVEVRVGHFLFTVNAVSGRSEMVRRARFRSSLARNNHPLLFPPELLPELYPHFQDSPMFGMILHGPLYPNLSKVGFVSMGFPAPDVPAYLWQTIDLINFYDLTLYPEIAEETIEDRAIPQRRKETQIKEK